MWRHYKKNKTALVAIEAIASRIVVLRGQRVMLDADLAALYGVTTKRLNEQVRRNLGRFPSDFMFQLTNQEVAILRSQFATLKTGHGQHRKYLPLAFTEHGACASCSPRTKSSPASRIASFIRCGCCFPERLFPSGPSARRSTSASPLASARRRPSRASRRASFSRREDPTLCVI